DARLHDAARDRRRASGRGRFVVRIRHYDVARAPEALDAAERSRLAFGVVVHLPRDDVLDAHLVLLARLVAQPQPGVPARALDLLAAAAEAERPLPDAAGLVRRGGQRQRLPLGHRLVDVVIAAAYREAEPIGDQGTRDVEVGRAVVAESIALLRGEPLRDA